MAGSQQGMGKPADMICLCIGGRLFVTRRATLYRLPESRLYLIATQGSSCQTMPGTGTPSSNPLNMSNPLSGFQSSNISERTVVAGATILPANVASLVTGNMNLKSASSLCRNRMSIVPGVSPQPAPLLPMTDSNTSMNLSVPVTPQPSGQMPLGFYPIQQAPPVVYFYDRDPEIFRFVLDYYRTGELHLPSSICGPFVRKELIFWGIDESLIGPCCMPAYMRYDEEKRTKNTLFRDCFEDIDSMQNLVKFSRGWKKWRYRMWLFMDHPSSSLPAKIWASCLLVLMIASVMCYCLSTHEGFRMNSTVLYTTHSKLLPTNPISINNQPIISTNYPSELPHSLQRTYYPQTTSNTQSHKNQTAGEKNNSNVSSLFHICGPRGSAENPKMEKDCSTEPTNGLVLADITLNCLFTAEFMLKVLLAPDKPRFLSSIVSILDIIILSSYWVYMGLFYVYYYHPKMFVSTDDRLREELSGYLWLMNILSMAQAMRILRIFKISKISRILRVLILTVKKSIPELVLLGFLLMNGMFMFSCLMYMAEYRISDTFQNIPESFWWSIITLTAVGYGDMHPKGGPGYFVGSVTAICGCIVTGLAIPIIGNNFNTYYKYMKNQLMEDKYLKALRKDMEATGQSGGKGGIGAAVEKGGLPLPGRKPRQQMNRRNIRDRGRHKGLKEKLEHALHVTTDPLRRYFTRGSGSRRVGNRYGGISNSSAVGSLQPLTENQHITFNSAAARKSIADAIKLHRESEHGIVNVTGSWTGLAKLGFDFSDREARPSLISPLTTDNLLTSLTPSKLSSLNTPHIWIDGEEAEENLSNNGCLLTLNDGHSFGAGYVDSGGGIFNDHTGPNLHQFENISSPRHSYHEVDFIPLQPQQMAHPGMKQMISNNVSGLPVSQIQQTENSRSAPSSQAQLSSNNGPLEKRTNYV